MKSLLVLLLLALCAAAANVKVLSKDSFDEEVVKSDKNVFVKFYAPWCGHCRHIAPTWTELAGALPEDSDVVVAEYDADAEKTVPQKYGVGGYPTLKFFPKGKKSSPLTYSGPRDLASLQKYIEENKE